MPDFRVTVAVPQANRLAALVIARATDRGVLEDEAFCAAYVDGTSKLWRVLSGIYNGRELQKMQDILADRQQVAAALASVCKFAVQRLSDDTLIRCSPALTGLADNEPYSILAGWGLTAA